MLAYSSGAALRESIQADGETDTSAMGQPVLAVLRYVLAGPYAGMVIDNSSAPARAVLPRELLEKLVEQADPSLEVKTLLAGERTAGHGSRRRRSAHARDVLGRREQVAPRAASGSPRRAPTTARGCIELYSHPLEVASLRRGDQAAPMTGAAAGRRAARRRRARRGDRRPGRSVDPALA